MQNNTLRGITVAQCVSCLSAHDNILILTHARPDGDTIGSGAALCAALRQTGKSAFLYPNAQVGGRLMPYFSPYAAHDTFEADYVVSVDTASMDLVPSAYTGTIHLSIDHHPSNTFYAAQTLLSAQSAACGELVFQVISEMQVRITPEIADLLYIAISTDTGCFCYDNTTAETMQIASALIQAGAKHTYLNKILFRTDSFANVKIKGLVNSSITLHYHGKVAVATLTLDMMQEVMAEEDDCENLSALPGRIAGVSVGVLIREVTKEQYKVSMRTTSDMNANEICSKFGGGGHARAAGCTIFDTYEGAKQKLLSVIGEVIG